MDNSFNELKIETPCLICELKLTPIQVQQEIQKAIVNKQILRVGHTLTHNHVDFSINQEVDGQMHTRIIKHTKDIIQKQAPIIQVLKLFLENGTNFNSKESTDQTMLHLAVKNRLTLVIDFLLSHGANLNVTDNVGNSILHFLIKTESQKFDKSFATYNHTGYFEHPLEKESADFIMWMILKGLDVDYANKIGYTALHLAAKFKLLHALPTLIEHTKNVNIVDDSEMTAFQIFVSTVPKFDRKLNLNQNERNWNGIYEKFLYKGFSVNVADTIGRTPLYFALNQDRIPVIKLILNNTLIDVNAQDNFGTTALHFVINYLKKNSPELRTEYYEILRILVSKGANIHQINSKGISPLIDAVVNEQLTTLKIFKEHGCELRANYNGGNLLHLSCKSVLTGRGFEDYLQILDLLLDEELNINVKDSEGMTPLHYAARGNRFRMVEKLIERKANLNSRSLKGSTPLHEAVEYSCEYSLELLIENRADIDAYDNNGKTPLHIAAQSGKNKFVEKFIEYGANLNSRDFHDGCTPLHEAVKNNRDDTVKVLIDNGADVNAKTYQGLTPVLYAAILPKGDNAMKNLLKLGADMNVNAHALRPYEYKASLGSVGKHLMKLKAANLHTDKNFDFIFGCYNLKQFYDDCLKEIEKLKNYKISDCMSLYDLLHVNRYTTCSYVENEKLNELINSPTYEKQFPLYNVLISASHYLGLQRRLMLQPAKDALQKFVNIALPELCLHEIIGYLSITDLRNLIEGSNIAV